MGTFNAATYGAVGDDSTNNDTAFTNLKTAARLDNPSAVIININPGIYRLSTQSLPFCSILNLTVNGTGASLKFMTHTGRLTTSENFEQLADIQSYVNTVPFGQSFVVCKVVTDAAFFPVGRAVALTALEWQGSSGFPPNHQYCQYGIVSATNSSTGRVDLLATDGTAFAARVIFRDTYPKTSSDPNYVTGGPATLHLMVDRQKATRGTIDGAWLCDVTINDLTWINATGAGGEQQVYCPGKRVVANRMSFTACAPIASANEYVEFNGCAVPDVNFEWDKDTVQAVCRNGSHRYSLFQSSSMDTVIFDNETINGPGGQGIQETPKRLFIRNGCIVPKLKFGCDYGTTESVEARDSTISAIDWNSAARHDIADFTESGGNLTYIGSGVLPLGAEGSQLFLAGQHSAGSNYAHLGFPTWVQAVQDSGASRPKLTTRLPLTAPSFTIGVVYVTQHPCRDVSFYDCTGCPETLDLSRAPKNLPLFSYCNRQDQSFATEQTINMWGYLVYLKVNVKTPSTRAAGACNLLMAQFSNRVYIKTDGSFGSDFGPIINTKVAGLRTITPTSITGTQSGDTLGHGDNVTNWGKIWFVDSIAPVLSATADTNPVIDFEMLTDQFQIVGRLR